MSIINPRIAAKKLAARDAIIAGLRGLGLPAVARKGLGEVMITVEGFASLLIWHSRTDGLLRVHIGGARKRVFQEHLDGSFGYEAMAACLRANGTMSSGFCLTPQESKP